MGWDTLTRIDILRLRQNGRNFAKDMETFAFKKILLKYFHGIDWQFALDQVVAGHLIGDKLLLQPMMT